MTEDVHDPWEAAEEESTLAATKMVTTQMVSVFALVSVQGTMVFIRWFAGIAALVTAGITLANGIVILCMCYMLFRGGMMIKTTRTFFQHTMEDNQRKTIRSIRAGEEQPHPMDAVLKDRSLKDWLKRTLKMFPGYLMIGAALAAWWPLWAAAAASTGLFAVMLGFQGYLDHRARKTAEVVKFISSDPDEEKDTWEI